MVKKLICLIFAVCTVLYTVPAYAVSGQQIEQRLYQYLYDEVGDVLLRECKKYNVEPPKNIEIRSELIKAGCCVVLIIDGPGDPRVVAKVTEMIGKETANILTRLGMSEKKMKQDNYMISVIPATKDTKGKWRYYDGLLFKFADYTISTLTSEQIHAVTNRKR